MRFITAVIIAIYILMASLVASWGSEENRWDLDGVTTIRVNCVSGDIVILPVSDGGARVVLASDILPREGFTPIVERVGNVLKIKEEWGEHSSGDVTWTIYLKEQSEGLTIQVSNASGDLRCSHVGAEISLETASGNIELSDARLAPGCTFNTASGDILLKNCTCEGDVEFSSASGDIEVENSVMNGQGHFSSASGDVTIRLDRLPKKDVSASSASGNVTLDVGDPGTDFTLVLIKRKDTGRISCPFGYTEEDEFEDHHMYVRKIIKRGSGMPVIELRTASGDVTVKD